MPARLEAGSGRVGRWHVFPMAIPAARLLRVAEQRQGWPQAARLRGLRLVAPGQGQLRPVFRGDVYRQASNGQAFRESVLFLQSRRLKLVI